MSSRVPHPFDVPKPSILRHFYKPSVIGTISAATFAAFPSHVPKLPAITEVITDPAIQIPEALNSELARKIGLAVMGFVVGYGSFQGIEWLRIAALRKLLTYRGWVLNPKTTKTKVWGILLSLLRGREPFGTFEFQSLLPKQPLPDLNQSLDTWLEIAEFLLSEDDFELTKELVEDFRGNEGPKLHAYLQDKAKKEDSWIADYWMNIAYLSSRQPLPIYNNYFMSHASDQEGISQISRAAMCTYNIARFEDMLSNERLPPVFIQKLVPLCMNNFRFLFNSNRIPGDYIDELVRYPGNRHIVVIRKGQYFKVDLHNIDDMGIETLLSPYELKLQYEKIIRLADGDNSSPSSVAALTGQERSVWAKNRRELEKLNSETLKEVDTAMFVVSLDDESPKDNDEYLRKLLVGNGQNIWFDKCFNLVLYSNSTGGCVVEHSALDAMIFCVMTEYITLFDIYENKDVPSHTPRSLPPPTRLHWNMQGMDESVTRALEFYKKQDDDIQTHTMTPPYGKRYMKQQRISPDGYIQMSLQLAFHRMHKTIPKTYEPSTGRMFLLGRTETVHPGSSVSAAWVKSMDDPNASKEEKIALLRKAIKLQTSYRLKATIGNGCDRHLIAMLCASRELGMDMPKLFTEKAFRLPFQLSTSQAPNMFVEYGCKLDFSKCFGGFGPTDTEGYGVGYCVFGEDRINFQISCWNSSNIPTNAVRFGEYITAAFEDIKMLFC